MDVKAASARTGASGTTKRSQSKTVGALDGCADDGFRVGGSDGAPDGFSAFVGANDDVGARVGRGLGDGVGRRVGRGYGTAVGADVVGVIVGEFVGSRLGSGLGSKE